MANLTLTQMRSEVYAQLAESSGFYTDNQLTQWLKDGQRHVCMQTEPLLTTATVTTTASTGEYALPTDLISVKQALYKDSSSNWYKLTETTYEAMWDMDGDWEDDTGQPDRWFWRAQVIGIYPAPSATYAGTNKLRIVYTYLAAAFSGDSAESGLPEFLDVPIIQYAVYRARLKDRDPQLAAIALADYSREIDLATVKLNKQRKNHAPRLVPDQSSYRRRYGPTGRNFWIRVGS